ncbi:hypothetical protein F5Y15DRAFT_413649 [Xylariaceae sp. FL0016]|nr:hypothetical protein F5Y15DRAFT_413649 [Xylariaceae sp. FL0016]
MSPPQRGTWQGSLILTWLLQATAVPNVTVRPLPETCASYPGYDSATGIAGPFNVSAYATGQPIDGLQFVPKFAVAAGGGAWGFMTIPLDDAVHDPATPMRCGGHASLQAQLDMGAAAGGALWQDLVAAGTPGESVLGFNLAPLPDPNYIIEPYAHAIDGIQQPGVFIGALNVTTWGFNYENSTETGEYYFLRLLGPNSHNMATGEQLNPGEFTGFIKVDL